MANWCSNHVVFIADDEKRRVIHELFAGIEADQTKDNTYHLPSFAKEENGVMVDIIVDAHCLTYETRWIPNLALLMEIADFYGAGFVSHFEEMQNGVFGEARYEAGRLTAVTLDLEDFAAIRYDAARKGYSWGDHFSEHDGDLLDHILEQKKQNLPGVLLIEQDNNNGPGR